MNWGERQVSKLVWKGMEKRMPQLKRWAPLLGVAVLAGSTIARAFGREDVAKGLDVVGSVTGVGAESPITGNELLATAAAVSGLILKVLSIFSASK